jgi:hypothetical protein
MTAGAQPLLIKRNHGNDPEARRPSIELRDGERVEEVAGAITLNASDIPSINTFAHDRSVAIPARRVHGG